MTTGVRISEAGQHVVRTPFPSFDTVEVEPGLAQVRDPLVMASRSSHSG